MMDAVGKFQMLEAKENMLIIITSLPSPSIVAKSQPPIHSHTEMAGVTVPSAEVLLSKRVQQMVIAGDEPLGPYLCRNDTVDAVQHHSTATSPIPVLDIGCFWPKIGLLKKLNYNCRS